MSSFNVDAVISLPAYGVDDVSVLYNYLEEFSIVWAQAKHCYFPRIQL